MSEKKKGKKNIANVLKRNRERFLKPLITEEDFKDDSDVFLSAVKNRSKTEKHSHLEKHSYFLSPMRGKVVDRSTFPVTSSKGKIDKQYDFIRTSKRIQKEELKTKLGHEYYEFNVINNRIKAERLKRSHTVKNINSVEQEDVESAVINETKPVFKSEVDTKLIQHSLLNMKN
jgi:hypothetical protein